MQARQTALTNGIRVITATIPHVQSVTMGIWAAVGGRHESARLSGVSHFIEHLLFKGTRRRSAKDISQAIEGRGGYLNAFTQEESTCYYARIAFDQLGAALDVLSDMYMNSVFDAVEIEKEKGVIVEEMMMYRDQPQHMAQEMLTEALWPGHPLGRPLIGTPATLRRMTRGDILAYKRRCYAPRATVVALAGRVDHEVCVEAVDKLLGGMTEAAAARFRRAPGSMGQRRAALRHKEIEQTHAAMGIRLFGRHDSRRYALRVLSAVLGENMSSRLFQIVREKHGLAYSIHSTAQLFDESGALVVSAGLDRKRTDRAMDLIVRELARLREEPVGRAELKRAKDYVIGQLRLGMESTTNQMMWLGDNMLSHGRFIPPEEAIGLLSAVTAEDVQGLARSVLRASRASVAAISPEVNEKDTARWAGKLDGMECA